MNLNLGTLTLNTTILCKSGLTSEYYLYTVGKGASAALRAARNAVTIDKDTLVVKAALAKAVSVNIPTEEEDIEQ